MHAAVGALMVIMACSSVCGYLKFIEVLPGDVGCVLPDGMIYGAFSDYVTATTITQVVVWVVCRAASKRSAKRI
jgi:hypothetical protein